MFDTDLSDLGKDVLAFIAGVGILGIVLFFYFFMMEETYENIYVMTLLVMIMAVLMVFFYVFDDLGFVFTWALMRDETGDFKDKLRRWSNLVSGMLLMGLVGINIIAFSSPDLTTDHGIRILIITCLTSFSVFLFLYSLFMES